MYLCIKFFFKFRFLNFSNFNSYLFLNAMVDDKVYTFVMVLVLACMDFWVVKNVTARYLNSVFYITVF